MNELSSYIAEKARHCTNCIPYDYLLSGHSGSFFTAFKQYASVLIHCTSFCFSYIMQAIKVCLEQLVGPNTPEHVKRSAADVLACACMGRHPQCALALLNSDINDLIFQAIKIGSFRYVGAAAVEKERNKIFLGIVSMEEMQPWQL